MKLNEIKCQHKEQIAHVILIVTAVAFVLSLPPPPPVPCIILSQDMMKRSVRRKPAYSRCSYSAGCFVPYVHRIKRTLCEDVIVGSACPTLVGDTFTASFSQAVAICICWIYIYISEGPPISNENIIVQKHVNMPIYFYKFMDLQNIGRFEFRSKAFSASLLLIQMIAHNDNISHSSLSGMEMCAHLAVSRYIHRSAKSTNSWRRDKLHSECIKVRCSKLNSLYQK